MIFEFIFPSIVLGITIALIPGPILVLTINETLMKGIIKGGIPIILGMLLVDLLIIIPFSLIASSFFQNENSQMILNSLGGTFLFLLGMMTIKKYFFGSKLFNQNEINTFKSDQTLKKIPITNQKFSSIIPEMKSGFFKIIIVQLFNPMAYIFWFTVGTGQTLLIINNYGFFFIFLFPVCFWIGIIGVSSLVIFLTAKGKDLLSKKWFKFINIGCGIVLVCYGLYMWFLIYFNPR